MFLIFTAVGGVNNQLTVNPSLQPHPGRRGCYHASVTLGPGGLWDLRWLFHPFPSSSNLRASSSHTHSEPSPHLPLLTEKRNCLREQPLSPTNSSVPTGSLSLSPVKLQAVPSCHLRPGLPGSSASHPTLPNALFSLLSCSFRVFLPSKPLLSVLNQAQS